MRMDEAQFTELILQAYQQLPDPVLAALADGNLDILVQDWPGPEANDAASDHDAAAPDLLGLYVGVPLSDRYGGEPALPDCIYIYRRPILALCSSRAQLENEIRITLWHEIGHYLGLSEADLDRLGYG